MRNSPGRKYIYLLARECVIIHTTRRGSDAFMEMVARHCPSVCPRRRDNSAISVCAVIHTGCPNSVTLNLILEFLSGYDKYLRAEDFIYIAAISLKYDFQNSITFSRKMEDPDIPYIFYLKL